MFYEWRVTVSEHSHGMEINNEQRCPHIKKPNKLTFNRTSANSFTTFFFLCKYRNSSSSCPPAVSHHRCTSLSFLLPCTHNRHQLRPDIRHVLVEGGHKPCVVREEIGPVFGYLGEELGGWGLGGETVV